MVNEKTVLYQYKCNNDHDTVFTWVDWHSSQGWASSPCCAECGSHKHTEWTQKTMEVTE